MTLLEKIKNLTWWTLDIKLKDILLSLLGRVEIIEQSGSVEEAPLDGIQYARQDGEWSEVSGGGGNQDLQSVLDIGNEVIGQNNDGTKIIFIDTNAYDDEGTPVEEISEAIYGADIKIKYTNNQDESQDETSIKGGDIRLEYSDGINITRSTNISSGNIEVKYGEAGLYLSAVSSGDIGSFRELGAIWFNSALNGNPNSLTILSENPTSTGEDGSYLDLRLPSHTGSQTRTLATLDDIQAPLPTYADNATAIAGGLVVNNHYKTATGELRVVI